MSFGGGGGRYPPSSLNPGTGGNRDPIKPYHDEISYRPNTQLISNGKTLKARSVSPRGSSAACWGPFAACSETVGLRRATSVDADGVGYNRDRGEARGASRSLVHAPRSRCPSR
jgi:hypothetical protein